MFFHQNGIFSSKCYFFITMIFFIKMLLFFIKMLFFHQNVDRNMKNRYSLIIIYHQIDVKTSCMDQLPCCPNVFLPKDIRLEDWEPFNQSIDVEAYLKFFGIIPASNHQPLNLNQIPGGKFKHHFLNVPLKMIFNFYIIFARAKGYKTFLSVIYGFS